MKASKRKKLSMLNQKWVAEIVTNDGERLGVFAIGDHGNTNQFKLATKFDRPDECRSLCDRKNEHFKKIQCSGRSYQPMKPVGV
jgi:hypothetical protein